MLQIHLRNENKREYAPFVLHFHNMKGTEGWGGEYSQSERIQRALFKSAHQYF